MQLYSAHAILTFRRIKDKLNDSLIGLFNNMIANQFEIYDEEKQPVELKEAIERATQIILSGFPVTVYAKAKGAFVKIIIDRSHERGDEVRIIPQEPFVTKKGLGTDEDALDLGLYVQLMIELTENFAIVELYTLPIE